MMQKINILLSISFFVAAWGCTVTRAQSINEPPTKSFVKIIHTINVISCSDPGDEMCPKGTRYSSGSGMAIKLLSGIPTVVTAGHVCDVAPTDKIENFIQTVEVMDHNSNIHQAYPILISHNNHKGSPDACMLYVPTLNVKAISYDSRKPKIGEELYYIGAPLGIYHAPNPLIFKGIFSGNINPSTAQITAPAIGGCSGSAILNSRKQIVGILWGTNLHFHHSSVMTSHKSFLIFLNNSKKKLRSLLQKP